MGPRRHLGVEWWNEHVTCSSLMTWGISASLKLASKVYFGPGPNLVMVLEVKNRKPRWVHAATWGQVVELTRHMFFSYPMEISASLKRGPKVYFSASLKTWAQSILWPRTQLGDGPQVKKS